MVPKKASNVGHKRHPASAFDKDLKLLETFFEPGRQTDGAEGRWGVGWGHRVGDFLQHSIQTAVRLNTKTTPPPPLPPG